MRSHRSVGSGSPLSFAPKSKLMPVAGLVPIRWGPDDGGPVHYYRGGRAADGQLPGRQPCRSPDVTRLHRQWTAAMWSCAYRRQLTGALTHTSPRPGPHDQPVTQPGHLVTRRAAQTRTTRGGGFCVADCWARDRKVTDTAAAKAPPWTSMQELQADPRSWTAGAVIVRRPAAAGSGQMTCLPAKN